MYNYIIKKFLCTIPKKTIITFAHRKYFQINDYHIFLT